MWLPSSVLVSWFRGVEQLVERGAEMVVGGQNPLATGRLAAPGPR